MTRLLALLVGLLLFVAGRAFAAVDIPEPKGLPEMHEITLDAPWTTMTTGGGGRYLVFHLPELKKVALFDVAEGNITTTIDAPGEDLVLAGGLEQLMVLVPSQKVVHRYAIATLKREKTFPTPANFKPKFFLLGSESNGPIVTYSEPPVTMYNTDAFKPLTYKGDVLQKGVRLFGDYGYELTMSADGSTVVGWVPNISGQPYHVMKISGNNVMQYPSPEGYSHGGRYLKPNADGSLFFLDGRWICGPNLKPLAADHLKNLMLYACDDPRYFVALESDDPKWKNPTAWICASGTLQKIAAVKDLGPLNSGILASEPGRWQYEPRVRYYPTANVVVSLLADQTKIRVRRANLKELLAAQNPEGYLQIISNPPRAAVLGQEYKYQIETLASDKKIKFKLESGPNGMKLSPQGELRWKPTAKPEGGVANVVIVVTDWKGGERFHSFEIAVDRLGGAAAPNPPAAK